MYYFIMCIYIYNIICINMDMKRNTKTGECGAQSMIRMGFIMVLMMPSRFVKYVYG